MKKDQCSSLEMSRRDHQAKGTSLRYREVEEYCEFYRDKIRRMIVGFLCFSQMGILSKLPCLPKTQLLFIKRTNKHSFIVRLNAL